MNILRLIAVLTVLFLSMLVIAARGDDLVVDEPELISRTELRAAVQAAQQKLGPASIYRASVISSTKVMVWYGDSNARSHKCLVLQRGNKNGWHVTSTGGYEY